MDDAALDERGPDGGAPDDLPGTWVRGRSLILALAAVMVVVVLVNFVAARHNNTVRAQRADADRIVHDRERTRQSWRTTADGMIVTMRSARSGDTAVVDGIRRYLSYQRGQYLRASYDDSAHPNGAPASADLEFATSHLQLDVRYRATPGGGSLHWILVGDARSDPDTRCVVAQSLREWAASVSTSRVVDAVPLRGC